MVVRMALCTFLRRQRERQLRRQAQRERQPVRELERLECRELSSCGGPATYCFSHLLLGESFLL